MPGKSARMRGRAHWKSPAGKTRAPTPREGRVKHRCHAPSNRLSMRAVAVASEIRKIQARASRGSCHGRRAKRERQDAAQRTCASLPSEDLGIRTRWGQIMRQGSIVSTTLFAACLLGGLGCDPDPVGTTQQCIRAAGTAPTAPGAAREYTCAGLEERFLLAIPPGCDQGGCGLIADLPGATALAENPNLNTGLRERTRNLPQTQRRHRRLCADGRGRESDRRGDRCGRSADHRLEPDRELRAASVLGHTGPCLRADHLRQREGSSGRATGSGRALLRRSIHAERRRLHGPSSVRERRQDARVLSRESAKPPNGGVTLAANVAGVTPPTVSHGAPLGVIGRKNAAATSLRGGPSVCR